MSGIQSKANETDAKKDADEKTGASHLSTDSKDPLLEKAIQTFGLIATTFSLLLVSLSVMAGVLVGDKNNAIHQKIRLDGAFSPEAIAAGLLRVLLILVVNVAVTVITARITAARRRETPAMRRLERKVFAAFQEALEGSAANPIWHRRIVLSDSSLSRPEPVSPAGEPHAAAI